MTAFTPEERLQHELDTFYTSSSRSINELVPIALALFSFGYEDEEDVVSEVLTRIQISAAADEEPWDADKTLDVATEALVGQRRMMQL